MQQETLVNVVSFDLATANGVLMEAIKVKLDLCLELHGLKVAVFDLLYFDFEKLLFLRIIKD